MQLAETIENREVAVYHTVLLSVSQHPVCKMLRKKVIEISHPSVFFFFNSVQYFLQISLKSSRFFFLEKYQETQNPNKYWLIQKYFGLSND